MVATVPTVNSIETLDGCEYLHHMFRQLQQYLPFSVCAAECESVEEQRDDEAHTLLT